MEPLLARKASDRLRLALRESGERSKGTEAALQYFRAALDASADMVLLIDFRRGTFVDFNESTCRQLGYTRAELLARGPGGELVQNAEALIASDERSDIAAVLLCRKDGSTFPAELRRTVHDTSGGPILVVSARDLTERRDADERQALHLRYQEALARFGHAALEKRDPKELTADAVAALREGLGADEVVYIDRAELPEALQTSEPFVGSGAALPFGWAHVYASAALVTVRGDNIVRGALCALSHGDDAYWANELSFLRTAASLLSTGLQRIESERRVAFLAQFDPLTGLANRTLLTDRFAQMIVQAKRHGSRLAVLFIDLDGFKLVNDSLGHAAGDELLSEVADRLQQSIRAGDTVARISGDEFAVVLADLARAEDAAFVAQKILDRLAEPIALGGKEAFVTASIGVAGF
ncbi:MAG TPA: sensor domain-containing diguanylate cyclase, partial [Burkholderiales bacterium]|nr:sensor domain-containing diguanylate cyclase [Burkholderiales bacterium]